MNIDLTKYRAYDPAIGRWWQVDPAADKNGQEVWSPYNYGFNNPIKYNDPLGDSPPNPLGQNPIGAMQEGFRRLGDAALSLFSATAEFFVNATTTNTNAPVGNSTLSISSDTKRSAYAKVNLSGVLDANPNNEVVLPEKVIDVGIKTTQTMTTALKNTTLVDGVPINTTLSTTINATDESITKSAELSVGVDKGNLQGKAFVNVSSTTNSDGSTTNKTSAGMKVQVPVYKDTKNTISIGGQVKLEHEY